MAIQTSQQYRAMVEGLELAVQKIAYFAVFEKIYLRHACEAMPNLRRAIIQSYTAILEFFDRAMDFLSAGRAERLLKGLESAAGETDLDAFKRQNIAMISVGIIQLHVDNETLQHHEQKLRVLCSEIELSTQTLSLQIREVQYYLDSQQRKEYPNSISKINYAQHHQEKDNALPGTCKWLFEHKNYKSWRAVTASSLVFLVGDPGTGKSTLTARVVNRVREDQTD